jgi:hypothetical protein
MLSTSLLSQLDFTLTYHLLQFPFYDERQEFGGGVDFPVGEGQVKYLMEYYRKFFTEINEKPKLLMDFIENEKRKEEFLSQ